jgi:hypothetical protein
MTDSPLETPDAAKLRVTALARWDSEGGAGPDGPQRHDLPGELTNEATKAADPELQQLHIRIIALENLMIALLADASVHQRDLARDMAGAISPRPGATRHPLTNHAARQMLKMIKRAEHFRVNAKSRVPLE